MGANDSAFPRCSHPDGLRAIMMILFLIQLWLKLLARLKAVSPMAFLSNNNWYALVLPWCFSTYLSASYSCISFMSFASMYTNGLNHCSAFRMLRSNMSHECPWR